MDLALDMARQTRIPPKSSKRIPSKQIRETQIPEKQPNRPHFIAEWAEFKGVESQQELADALEVDKSMVSRWYNGASPMKTNQIRLAKLFGCTPDAIFRHPNEFRLSHILSRMIPEEMDRAIKMLEAGFPAGNKPPE